MTFITANDLQTRGIADIERVLTQEQEVVISVDGQPRYVVVELAHYTYLRECETAAAWLKSRKDIAAGRYVSESAHAHMARIEREPVDEPKDQQ